MSRILAELPNLPTRTLHRVELDLCRIILRLEVTDPRTNTPRALPPGPTVSLVRKDGTSIDRIPIMGDGRVYLLGNSDDADVGIHIDFDGREWLDLDANAYVSAAKVRANDERPLLRLPRAWSSRNQATFSDDRGGTFANGDLSVLEDGKLGTADEPWVLQIDHAWTKLLLELRYTNTHASRDAPLPPGPLVDAGFVTPNRERRLAATSTVLDDQGTVALWIFDPRVQPADLRIALRTARDSHVEMDAPAPGKVSIITADAHAQMSPEQRERLHPLPPFLRLHEQPGSQDGRTDLLPTLLASASPAPARVRVQIDVPIDLRLTIGGLTSQSPVPLPPGAFVTLRDGEDRFLIGGRTGDDGRIVLFAPPGSHDVSIDVSFGVTPYVDIVEGELVSETDAEPNTKRRLVRMPDRWRSIHQSAFSDDRNGAFAQGRLAKLEPGTLGTPDAPWEIDLTHAWPRFDAIFVYHDVTARDLRPVPFGPLVEAFADPRMRPQDLVAASTVLDADGRCRLFFFRAIHPTHVLLRFRTAPDTAIDTANTDPEQRLLTITDPALQQLNLGRRQEHYRLPTLWLSRGQRCCSALGGTDWNPFPEQLAAAETTDANHGATFFDLDDFVLVNAEGVPLKFRRGVDVTIFHHDFSIRSPRTATHEPYFTDTPNEVNHFHGHAAYYTPGSGIEGTARVIRRARTFYDLTGTRTTRGELIGLRAAIANAHPHERIFLKHAPGTSPNLANCDLHYFEDIAEDPATARAISVLLVFFSVRIRPIKTPVTVKDEETGAKTVIQVNRDAQRALQNALGRAEERWTSATLTDVFSEDVPDVPDIRLRNTNAPYDVKFVFHFPAFPDREGHAVIWLRPVRRAYTAASFGLMVVAIGDANAGASVAGVEHAHEYPSEVIAHELGHAMGLGDEYFAWSVYDIPKLTQPSWNFLHLSFDKHSLMYDEHAPRLRHYWIFARWLERSADIPRVKTNAYTIACDTSAVTNPTSGRTHAYRLPSEQPWPYEPLHVERDFRPGKGGRGRLQLFLLGDDLDVFTLPTSGVLAGIDAVLHWDLSIYVRRRSNADGESSLLLKEQYVTHIHEDIVATFGGIADVRGRTPRCLVAELATGMPATSLAKQHATRILLYVRPRFTFSNPAFADFRVHVRPRSMTRGADVTDLHDPSFSRRKIAVHEQVPGQALLRYMMGMGADGARPGAKVRVTGTPLPVGPSLAIGTSSLSSKVLHVVPGARTPGANDFNGSGTPDVVAAELAAALNDLTNSFSSHLTAQVRGNEVLIAGKPTGDDVTLLSAPPGISFQNEWGDEFEPRELAFLADWLGEKLGATYRIRVYD